MVGEYFSSKLKVISLSLLLTFTCFLQSACVSKGLGLREMRNPEILIGSAASEEEFEVMDSEIGAVRVTWRAIRFTMFNDPESVVEIMSPYRLCPGKSGSDGVYLVVVEQHLLEFDGKRRQVNKVVSCAKLDDTSLISGFWR